MLIDQLAEGRGRGRVESFPEHPTSRLVTLRSLRPCTHRLEHKHIYIYSPTHKHIQIHVIMCLCGRGKGGWRGVKPLAFNFFFLIWGGAQVR